jgi:hypothetical protein
VKVTRSVTSTTDGVQVQHAWTIESDGDVTAVLDEVERRIEEIAAQGDVEPEIRCCRCKSRCDGSMQCPDGALCETCYGECYLAKHWGRFRPAPTQTIQNAAPAEGNKS